MKKTHLLVAALLPSTLLLTGCFDKASQSNQAVDASSTIVKGAAAKKSETQLVLKDDKRTLLEVADLDQIHDSASKIIATHLEPMLVDFTQHTVTNSVSAISQYQQALQQDKVTTIELSSTDNPAGLTNKPSQQIIYRVHNSDVVILPIEGQGYLSYLKGFVALHLATGQFAKVRFYQQGETPALGGHIMTDRVWLQQFVGKLALKDSQPALKIVQPARVENNSSENKSTDTSTANPNQLDEYTIDGITGATNTSQRVEHIINYWLGDEGYGPILKQLNTTQS
ncbi:FMN-binding protein [Vibrio porteresiae]|uniref:FMN-binding protein n=1 Tax=Vibrio porteresiae DSM 19223 TaxID=1123496 RepID=A0ABZ0QHE2_9VIBR|nr:FMN-binding protein [Vibrio porteresiae]WPC75127.1 FMN-binding protein [Vibrio porteresiae DSM 19223]